MTLWHVWTDLWPRMRKKRRIRNEELAEKIDHVLCETSFWGARNSARLERLEEKVEAMREG